MKTAVIHQPDFLPYLGFFHRLLYCDVFIILDDAQFNRASSKTCWHNRDKIKTPSGEKWLTVSVEKAPLGTPINQIKLSRRVDWKKNNLNLIHEHYKTAPFYDEVMPHILDIYEFETDNLSRFNLYGLKQLMALFDISTPLILASTLNCNQGSNLRLINLLNAVHAKAYLSGQGAKAYFDRTVFDEAGIKVYWQEFAHPRYGQCHGKFIPFLSSIDLLLNCGITAARRILREI